MLIGSGFFLYAGFSMLFHPAQENPTEIKVIEDPHP